MVAGNTALLNLGRAALSHVKTSTSLTRMMDIPSITAQACEQQSPSWPRFSPSSQRTPRKSAGAVTGTALSTRCFAGTAPSQLRTRPNCSVTIGWSGGSTPRRQAGRLQTRTRPVRRVHRPDYFRWTNVGPLPPTLSLGSLWRSLGCSHLLTNIKLDGCRERLNLGAAAPFRFPLPPKLLRLRRL